jgi:hypothetical protein
MMCNMYCMRMFDMYAQDGSIALYYKSSLRFC